MMLLKPTRIRKHYQEKSKQEKGFRDLTDNDLQFSADISNN